MELAEELFSNLSLAGKSAVELSNPPAADNSKTRSTSKDPASDIYYLQIHQYTGSPTDLVSDGRLAVLCSAQYIRIYDSERIVRTATIDEFGGQVTKVRFGHSSPDLVYTALDARVRCWDLRTDLAKPVNEFKADDDAAVPTFLSFDISFNDKFFCAGTKLKNDEALIYFWDHRKTLSLGCYEDMHSDDVTQVRFNSSRQDTLLTAGDDGLVNLLDISESSEEDALQYTLDTESTPMKILGPSSQEAIISLVQLARVPVLHDKIGWLSSDEAYITTYCNKAYIWETETGDEKLIKQLSYFQAAPKSPRIDYMVDCFSTQSSPILLTGNNRCDGVLYSLNDSPSCLGSLPSGHSEWIRACTYNTKSQNLYTVGEDALLCCWKPSRLIEQSPSESKTNKIKSKHKTRADKPYKRK